MPLIALAIAFWPVWRWIFMRTLDASDDAWELLSLATAVAFLWVARADAKHTMAPTLPLVLVLIYAVSYQFSPPLLRACIAVTAIAAACSAIWFGRRMYLPLLGLLLLSLPVIASLSFYLGYPLRVVVGTVAQALLQMNGFAVVREGTLLNWGGQLISIDAPCSGIKMLWAGLYLSFTLAAFFRLDNLRTLLLGMLAVAVVIAANVLRTTALFFVEAKVVAVSDAWHGGIGILVFLLAAMTVAGMAHRLRVAAHAP